MANWIRANTAGLEPHTKTTPDMGGKVAAGKVESGAESAGLHKAAPEKMMSVKAQKLYAPKTATKF